MTVEQQFIPALAIASAVTINFRKERNTLTIKNILILSIFHLSVFLTFGQTEQQDIFILRNAIGKTPDSLITYIDKSTGWERIREQLDHKTFTGHTPETKPNSISLTKSESKLLKQQIKKFKDLSWEENLFAYSKRISSDSVLDNLNVRRKRLEKEIDDALASKDSATYNKLKNKESWVFGFSKPIYFRDQTFCLLYNVALCSSLCGYDEIAFYKKENENWSKWIVVAHGEF